MNYKIWPKTKFNFSDFYKKKISVIKIEDFFKNLYQTDYILHFSSGRSSIVNILRSLELERECLVSTAMFANSCIFRTVGHVSTPVPSYFKNQFRCSLVYHQWGYPTYTNLSNLIIEDSVDSIIYDKKGLFLNNGSYEIISLSKIFGFYSGAIIVAKNRTLYEKLKKFREENNFTNSNFFLVLLGKINKNYNEIWSHSQTLGATESKMMNFFTPKEYFNFNELINDRREKMNIIKPLMPTWVKLDKYRLPIVIPVNYSEKILEKLKKNNIYLPIRHFNKGQVYEEWNKTKVFCIPIHQEININILKKIFEIMYE